MNKTKAIVPLGMTAVTLDFGSWCIIACEPRAGVPHARVKEFRSVRQSRLEIFERAHPPCARVEESQAFRARTWKSARKCG